MGILIDLFVTILLVLYNLLGQNVFLAIVGFTVLIRMSLFPLTWKQQRSLKAMQEIQPEVKKLQEQYKDNREVLAQKQMELYRERGVNPLAGCLPLIVQLPILLGLWQAINATLATTPAQLFHLSEHILFREQFQEWFNWNLDALVPMNNHFLWLNLAVPDPYLLLPILVVITTYLQQKLLTPPATKNPNADPNDPAEQAAQVARQMTTIMPIMFGFFALTYSSGLSIYFILSNLIGIGQYAAMGKADYRRLLGYRELSDDQKKTLETFGRLRHDTMEDSRAGDSNFQSALRAADEKRSQQIKRATRKARSVKIDAN
jgi:YidC/Oxa1 family membrane protein insertase